MIIPDANILLYAYNSSSALHQQAREWAERVLSEEELVGMPWSTAGAFLRITTHPAITAPRMSIEESCQIVQSWIDQPNVQMIGPAESHWTHLQKMLIDGQTRGPLVSDAQLAALTIEHGGILHTTDRDFARFPGLRWINPLKSR